jgi:crotonobetainyl-CoA:carnitine CoA-transferase CaiB-like acyl-CoA transferase
MGMYGSEGPLSYQTGYAPCFAALGGLSALVGYEGEAPSGMNVRYADSTFGTMAAFATLVALLHRRRTGVGQFIDVSAVEAMSSMVGDSIVDFALNGVVHGCHGSRHPEMAPHGTWPCAGGEWISIAVATDDQWMALAGQLGLEAEPSLRTVAGRKAREQELERLLGEWTAGRDAAGLAAELQSLGIPAAKSASSLDLVSDPQLWQRGFYFEVEDSAGRSKTTVGPGWKMSRPAEVRDGAPRLGEHTGYVLGEVLGLSEDQQRELSEAGVTR